MTAMTDETRRMCAATLAAAALVPRNARKFRQLNIVQILSDAFALHLRIEVARKAQREAERVAREEARKRTQEAARANGLFSMPRVTTKTTSLMGVMKVMKTRHLVRRIKARSREVRLAKLQKGQHLAGVPLDTLLAAVLGGLAVQPASVDIVLSQPAIDCLVRFGRMGARNSTPAATVAGIFANCMAARPDATASLLLHRPKAATTKSAASSVPHATSALVGTPRRGRTVSSSALQQDSPRGAGNGNGNDNSKDDDGDDGDDDFVPLDMNSSVFGRPSRGGKNNNNSSNQGNDGDSDDGASVSSDDSNGGGGGAGGGFSRNDFMSEGWCMLEHLAENSSVRTMRCVASVVCSLMQRNPAAVPQLAALLSDVRCIHRVHGMLAHLWNWAQGVITRCSAATAHTMARCPSVQSMKEAMPEVEGMEEDVANGIDAVGEDPVKLAREKAEAEAARQAEEEAAAAAAAAAIAAGAAPVSEIATLDATSVASEHSATEEEIAAARAKRKQALKESVEALLPPALPQPTAEELEFVRTGALESYMQHVAVAMARLASMLPDRLLLRSMLGNQVHTSTVLAMVDCTSPAVHGAGVATVAHMCRVVPLALQLIEADALVLLRLVAVSSGLDTTVMHNVMSALCTMAALPHPGVHEAMWRAGMFSFSVRMVRVLQQHHGMHPQLYHVAATEVKNNPTMPPSPTHRAKRRSSSGPGGSSNNSQYANGQRPAWLPPDSPPTLRFAAAAALWLCQHNTPTAASDLHHVVQAFRYSDVPLLPYTTLLVWSAARSESNKGSLSEAMVDLGGWTSLVYVTLQRLLRPKKLSRSSGLSRLKGQLRLGRSFRSRKAGKAKTAVEHKLAADPGRALGIQHLGDAIRVHEYLVGTMWLLLYHRPNADLFLSTGSADLFTIMHSRRHQDERFLATIHMALAALWKASESGAARQHIVSQDLVPRLLTVGTDSRLPLRTRMLASDFILDLLREAPINATTRQLVKDKLQQRSGSDFAVIRMLMMFVVHPKQFAKRYGVAMIARSVMSGRDKEHLASIGGIKTLLDELKTTRRLDYTCDILHALVNMTTHDRCQEIVGARATRFLVATSRNHSNMLARDLASRVLFNIRLHPDNRTHMYRAELHFKAQEVGKEAADTGAGEWKVKWTNDGRAEDSGGDSDASPTPDSAHQQQTRRSGTAEGSPSGAWQLRWEPAVPQARLHFDSSQSTAMPLGGTSLSALAATVPASRSSTTRLLSLSQRMRKNTSSLWAPHQAESYRRSTADYELDHLTASGLWRSSKSPTREVHAQRVAQAATRKSQMARALLSRTESSKVANCTTRCARLTQSRVCVCV